MSEQQNNNPAHQDIKDMFETLSRNSQNLPPDKLYIHVTSKEVYDKQCEFYGENMGWDKNKVEIIIGYPKFDE